MTDWVNTGRPGPYGNPFIAGWDGTKKEVIIRHKFWLWQPEQKELRNRMRRALIGKKLFCPGCRGSKPCHNDNIEEVLKTDLELS